MIFPFSQVISLAESIPVLPDNRSEFLKNLRDAQHPTCPYYRFLNEVTKRWAPLNVLEIGTYCGTSAAHMAVDNVGGSVTTIDINPDAENKLNELNLTNVQIMIDDSLRAGEMLGKGGKLNDHFDVLYIDGWHDFNRTYQEYFTFRPFVKHGGLVIFDDVGLDMDGKEMDVFWEFVVDPKMRVDHLHPNTGFGIAQKIDSFTVPPWNDVIEEATRKIEANRKR